MGLVAMGGDSPEILYPHCAAYYTGRTVVSSILRFCAERVPPGQRGVPFAGVDLAHQEPAGGRACDRARGLLEAPVSKISNVGKGVMEAGSCFVHAAGQREHVSRTRVRQGGGGGGGQQSHVSTHIKQCRPKHAEVAMETRYMILLGPRNGRNPSAQGTQPDTIWGDTKTHPSGRGTGDGRAYRRSHARWQLPRPELAFLHLGKAWLCVDSGA